MIAQHGHGFSFSLSSLEALWRHTSDLIFEYDTRLQLISANPAAKDFLQVSLAKQNVFGKSNSELFGGEVGKKLDDCFDTVKRTKKPQLLEFQIKYGQTEKIFEALIVLAWEEQGELCRFIALARDITSVRSRYRELTNQLEHQKNFLLNVINTSPNHIFVKNKERRYTLLNDATARFFGHSRCEILGKTDEEINSENSFQFRDQDSVIFSGKTDELNFEEQVIDSYGKPRWFQTFKKKLIDPKTKETMILGNAVDITAIKQAEEEIRKSENLFRSTIANAPVIVFALDKNGVCTLSEGRGLSKIGLAPKEAVGKSVFETYSSHPQILEAVRTVLEEGRETRSLIEAHDRIFESSFSPLDKDGEIQGLIGVAYDVTERHKAQAALKFTQFSIDKSGEAAFWINSKGHIIYVNERACQLSGFTQDELLNRSIFDLSPLRRSGQWSLNWRKLREQSSLITEDELVCKDGRRIPIEVSQNFIRFDNKEFNCAFVKDITERKKVENALLENERRFRTMADASPAFIWIFGAQGECEYINRTFLEFLGKNECQPASSAFWKNAVHPDDLPIFMENFQQPADSAKVLNFELRILRADGHYRWIFAQGVPRYDQDEGFIGYLISAIDMTERKEAVDALRKAARELERSNRELEQFAYVASHDLQEPLRMISGFCQLLHEQYHSQLDDQADEYLGFILDGAQRMSALIRDLLLYSKTSREDSQTEIVDCQEVLNVVKSNLRLNIEKSGADIRINKLPQVKGNFNQFVQLFQNLIDNAIKYRSPDRNLIIEVSAQLKTDEWIFCVKDNGKGFEMKFQNRVFQIFQRLEKRGITPGSGIGLAIAKKIVENAGGQIWVESKPSVGSRFFFSWPRPEERKN